MKILAVDDEYLSLENLKATILLSRPDCTLYAFQDADEALLFAQKNSVDVAFLDIEMRTQNGVSFAKKILKASPKTNIIFVTGFSDYMKDAFDIHASGYVLKPVTASSVKEELENLRFRISEKKIKVRCFGDFAVFVDDVAISFAYAKSLELFAILVDSNGAFCSISKLIYMLWDNDDADTESNRSYLRNLISDLKRTLEKYGIKNILFQKRGKIAINRTKIECDYFDYLDKKDSALNAFNEEYMNQYSWAEEKLGTLISGRI